MSALHLVSALAPKAIEFIGNIFRGKQKAKENLAKIKDASENRGHAIKLKSADWENIGKRVEGKTLKDDVISFTIVAPIVMTYVSAFISAYTGDPNYLNAADAGVESLQKLLPNYSIIAEAVILAAIAIKVTR